MRMLRVVMASCVVLMGAASFGADYERGPVPVAGQVFYASFDHGPKADAGAGFPEMHYAGRYWGRQNWEFAFVDGLMGKALDLGPERKKSKYFKSRARGYEYACFKFQGQVCLRVGTLSFWFKDAPPKVEISSQTNDRWSGFPLLTLRGSSKEPVRGSILTRDYSRTPLLDLTNKEFLDGKWHHLAVVWDECQGTRAYCDGEAAGSNWGKNPFHDGYLSVGRLSLQHAQFDEVRVFDVALSQRQVKALAAGEQAVPDLAAPSPGVDTEHRLARLCWKDAPAEHFIPVSGPTTIRRVDLADARALRISGWRAVDGRDDSVWPVRYHGYEYLGGGALNLKMAPGEKFNFVRVTGRIDAASLCAGEEWEKPKDAAVIARFAGKQFIAGHRLSKPCTAPGVSVYPDQPRDYYRKEFKELHDIALLDVRPGGPSRGVGWLSGLLGGPDLKTVSGDNRVRLIHWYRPEERAILAGSAAAPGMREVELQALRFLHLMLPAQTTDTPMDTVRLQLKVDGWKRGNLVNVRLHDPFNLWRALMDVDLRLENDNGLDVSLQFPGTILPGGTELWLTLVSRDSGRVRCGAGESTLTVYGPEMAKAKKSYLTWQHRLLKDNMAVLSEPRPWGGNTFDDTFLRVGLHPYDAIARTAWDLHRRFPTDRWTRGYMLFTHPQDKPYWDSLPIDLPRDPRVPRWALLEKELLHEFLFFVNWWIDNRQVPNGELGNFYGDDTDLVNDWLSLSMIHDPDGKLKRSVRILADYCWRTKMKNGLNIKVRDALHAYEEGPNAQPVAALMDYGNPVLWERLMATARRYDGWLMSKPQDGKRVFRGYDFGDSDVRGGPGRFGYARLILHHGLALIWYNGSATLTQMMTEFFDGNTGFRGKTIGVPHILYLQTGDKRFIKTENLARSYWWMRILNRKQADEKALKELIDYQFDLGSTRSLGFGNYLPLQKYIAWHYTRDKSLLVPALEYLWKQTYYTMYLYTKTEQSGDRVAVHKNLTDFMYLGGMPGARNHIAPYFAVSYEGFSPEFAALVLEDTPELLRWVGFNFEEQPQAGAVRVWNLAPGTYEVRMGLDANDDDKIDGTAEIKQMELKRYETIPVTLPSHKLYVVEARCVRKDVPLHERCDLAITHEDATRKGTALTVVVHNIGRLPTGPFRVELLDAAGKTLGTKTHPGLDGIEDLQDKKIAITFDNVAAAGALRVKVAGEMKEITEVNNVARIVQ